MVDIDEAFLYGPYNLAVIVNNRDMSVAELESFLSWVSSNESEYLPSRYRDDSRALFVATMQYSSYLFNKTSVKEEKESIAKDNREAGLHANVNSFFYMENDPHHFLKALRLRVLYFNKNQQARTTLRRILSQYGYRRRNHKIIEEIEDYLRALRLVVITGSGKADLFNVKLDERLIIEVEQTKDEASSWGS